jgi:hypothetical protein
MKNILTTFTEHPASVGENYFSHMGMAIGFGARMLFCGFACLVHAFLPFLFVKTGSNTISHLHDTMVLHRNRSARKGALPADAVTGSSSASH